MEWKRSKPLHECPLANFLLMSKKQQRSAVGDEALKKVAVACKVVEQGINMLSFVLILTFFNFFFQF